MKKRVQLTLSPKAVAIGRREGNGNLSGFVERLLLARANRPEPELKRLAGSYSIRSARGDARADAILKKHS